MSRSPGGPAAHENTLPRTYINLSPNGGHNSHYCFILNSHQLAILQSTLTMPSLELRTNVKVADPKAFMLDFASVGVLHKVALLFQPLISVPLQFAAKVLGKPLSYISTSYDYNETLNFGGTFDPVFMLTIVRPLSTPLFASIAMLMAPGCA